MTLKATEGYMPYLGYQTYYRIVGQKSSKTPLLLLHGGPGSTHNYFEMLDDLASERQVIMYDQLGCGKSSIPDDPTLWHKETWVNELMALREYLHLEKVNILGQSWGGMLAIIYLCDYQPQGVQSVILASTLSSAKLWAQEQHRMIKFMTPDDQKAIAEAEKSGNYTTAAYLTANEHYMEQHAASPVTSATPEPLRRAKNSGTQSYNVAWGPNEYTPLGTLSDYEYTDKLNRIKIPTLITSGTNDLCTPLVAKMMSDQIPQAHWELFAHSRHMAFVDENERYLQVLNNWLKEV